MGIAVTDPIAALFAKEHVTVLVTDSGLGGMAVFAQIAARLKGDPIFPSVSLIYYNAWPEQARGYNRFDNMAERIRVFDGALTGMKRYRPDIIMIACNTLSVLYHQTEFSRREAVPVVDIVGFGTRLVYQALTANTRAQVVLLGTVTTIASGVHRSRLVERGVSPERLVEQPCDQLATHIERGPGSPAVVQLVDRFMARAARQLTPGVSAIYAALFCTHFGYCRDLIKEKLQQYSGGKVTILDPNRSMAAYLFETGGDRRYADAAVNLKVVSRIVWETVKIDAIASIVSRQSAPTARALKNYEHNPDLFTF